MNTAELHQEQNRQTFESEKTFDVMASVQMLRYDIEKFGAILPETMQRVYDEELTLIAEGIDRHSYTKFSLKNDENQGLVFFNKGKWSSYTGSVINGHVVAKREAESDYRKNFYVDMTTQDIEKAYAMQGLEVGEFISWYSAFPEKEYQEYGAELLTDMGFKVDRKMGFLYRAEKQLDGTVTLESHSVDDSNLAAFEAAMLESELNPAASITDLVNAYDDNLYDQTGNETVAGRDSGNNEENAWEFVQQNKPLVNYYLDKIKELAYSAASYEDLYDEKEQLTFGVWARIKELLSESVPTGLTRTSTADMNYDFVATHNMQIEQQVNRAFRSASQRGDVLVGCGGTIKGKSAEETFDSIFGSDVLSNGNGLKGKEDDEETDQFGSLSFQCENGHRNRRPRGKLIDCRVKGCKGASC